MTARAHLVADALLSEFGSLQAVLASTKRRRSRILADEPAAEIQLAAVRSAYLDSLREQLSDRPLLENGDRLARYLHASMAYDVHERVRVLFLDSANRLIRDEIVGSGGALSAPIYPREIMRRAIENGATALIIAHNHPSGDPTPSIADVRATRELIEAGKALEVMVHDHIVIGRIGWKSMRALGLI